MGTGSLKAPEPDTCSALAGVVIVADKDVNIMTNAVIMIENLVFFFGE